MTKQNQIHLIKLVVGCSTLESFCNVQDAHQVIYNGQKANIISTRSTPKQADDILKTGGSAYRVIKGTICCRQKILGFETITDPVKGKMCQIFIDTNIIETRSLPKRAFQGWRYLKPEDAPEDLNISNTNKEMPEDMKRDLIELGLL